MAGRGGGGGGHPNHELPRGTGGPGHPNHEIPRGTGGPGDRGTGPPGPLPWIRHWRFPHFVVKETGSWLLACASDDASSLFMNQSQMRATLALVVRMLRGQSAGFSVVDYV